MKPLTVIIKLMPRPFHGDHPLHDFPVPAAAGRWRFSRGPRIAVLLGVAAVTAFLLLDTLDTIFEANPLFDQSCLLYEAARSLAGVQLYGPHLMEVNPPLIVWFSMIPELLAGWLHAPPLMTLKLLVAVLVFLSSAWCVRVVRSVGLARTTVLLGLCYFAITLTEVSLLWLHFAQREQMVIVFALPYLLYGACRSGGLDHQEPGRAERIALGFAAGVGFCMKPQEALILFGFELFLLLWTRQRSSLLRAECVAAVAAICGYVVIAAFGTPYFTHIVPLLRDVYWAYAQSSRWSQVWFVLLNPWFLGALAAWLLLRRRLRFPTATPALLTGAMGAAGAYILQGTDWPHHFFPCQALLWCAAGVIAVDLLGARLTALARPAVAIGWMLLFAAMAAPVVVRHEVHRLARDRAALARGQQQYVSKLFAGLPAGTTVYIFSTQLDYFVDIVRDRLVWGSRYIHLWPLPAIVQNELAVRGELKPVKVLPAERLHALEAMQRSTVLEDMQSFRPQVVVVQHCGGEHPCQALFDLDFDILGWFLQSPEFAAEWTHYRRAGGDGQFDVYMRVR